MSIPNSLTIPSPPPFPADNHKFVRDPLFKHIFITLEEGNVCKNSFKNAIPPPLPPSHPPMHYFIRLATFLPFREQIPKGLRQSHKFGTEWPGNSMVVAGLRCPRERKTQEIWPTSQLCSGLPQPQTKQWKMFSWPPLTHCLPFLLPRLVISAPTSSTGQDRPWIFSSPPLDASKANPPAAPGDYLLVTLLSSLLQIQAGSFWSLVIQCFWTLSL